MRRGIAAALLAVLAACGGRGAPEPIGPSAGCRAGTLARAENERRRLVVGGEERSYLLDAPGGPAHRPLPVVLAFHGLGSEAARMRAGGLHRLASRGEAIVVHPEGREGVRLLGFAGRGWDTRPGDTRDAAFVRALLETLGAERCVDRGRVFATGMSNGGLFANLLGCLLADRLAAVAPVAGAAPLEGCAAPRPLPVLLVHGRADEIVAPALARGARDWWLATNRCGDGVEREGCTRYAACAADVVWCEGPQGHVWPPGVVARLWEFFRAHPRRLAGPGR